MSLFRWVIVTRKDDKRLDEREFFTKDEAEMVRLKLNNPKSRIKRISIKQNEATSTPEQVFKPGAISIGNKRECQNCVNDVKRRFPTGHNYNIVATILCGACTGKNKSNFEKITATDYARWQEFLKVRGSSKKQKEVKKRNAA